MPPRVLLLTPSSTDASQIGGHLAARGYEVARREGLRAAEEPAADVVLADSRLGEAAVLALCERLGGGRTCLIVLNAGRRPGFCVEVLEAGADDCLAAPHHPRELLARVRSLLRRRERTAQHFPRRHYVVDQFVIDMVAPLIRTTDGRAVEVTPTQHRLLTALLLRAGEVVSRADLFQVVFGDDSESFDRAVDVQVSRLRKKLALIGASDLITSCRGVGYSLAA